VSGERTRRLLVEANLASPGDLLRGITAKEIYVMLGFACNIRCPICPFWGTTGISHDNGDERWHAPYDGRSLERFLAGMRAYGAQSLNVSGGEPLAFAHWPEVAAMGRRLGYRVTITTNGSLLERHIEKVRELADVLQLSFTDPAEWRRGFRTVDWAPALARLFAELKKKPGLEIDVNFAISDLAIGELEATADAVLGGRMAIDAFRIVHPMFLSPGMLLAHRAGLGELGSDGDFWRGFGTVPVGVDPDALVATLRRLRERYPGIGVFPEIDEPDIPGYYRDPTFLPHRFRETCAAPWTQANVVPNGDVWVCYDVRLGNIHTDEAEAIWNGPAARALRRRILEKGLFAGCRGCFNKYSALEGGTAPPPDG